MNSLAKLSLTVLAAVSLAGPALAGTSTYRANANSSRWIDLSLCSPQVRIEVTGDTDTDLDFEIYNPGGQRIFIDDDGTDYTWTTVNTGIYRREGICRTYKLKVTNYGDVYNMFDVTLN